MWATIVHEELYTTHDNGNAEQPRSSARVRSPRSSLDSAHNVRLRAMRGRVSASGEVRCDAVLCDRGGLMSNYMVNQTPGMRGARGV